MEKKMNTRKALLIVSVWSVTACAPPKIYNWGSFETAIHDRYVSEKSPQADEYLLSTITESEQNHLKVPPGVYADYGFVLFKRGDRNGAVAYFEKEKNMFPESSALMSKLIERVTQKKTALPDKNTMPNSPVPGSKP